MIFGLYYGAFCLDKTKAAMSMAMPISNNAKSAKDAGKKPNSGVNWTGQEKVLHEDMYNPMLDTTRKLLLIIREVPARASNSKFFLKLI